MKGCQVYKTKINYKITTLYKRESGAYLISNPIIIVPISVDVNILCDSVFQSLKLSRLIFEKEEDIFDINLLKALKEKSYNELYKKSTSCNIYLERGIIEIQPNQYLGKSRGLEAIQEKIIKIEYIKGKELEITKKIIELLEN